MIQPWFLDAKLGIFIHWGIYAVDGVSESWSWWMNQVPRDAYFGQLDGFGAERYDPAEWAALFASTGARYAVLTTKHHDGVALWDTDASDLSVPKKTPAARDVLGPWAEATRAAGLKVGFYFSHLDWSHPDYASVYPTRDSELQPDPTRYANRLSYPEPGSEDPERWERFLAFHRAQLRELGTRYRPDLWWFDGEWERDPEQFRMAEVRDLLLEMNPEMVANARLLGHGDYATPEQGIPINPPEGPWEFCMTLNDSWGWQGRDTNWKSVRQLVRIFTEVVGMGGNLLLDVGPKADGTIPDEARERLVGLGDWNRRHAEAIWGTGAGLPHGHHYGASTISADRRTLYLFCYDRIRDSVGVKGIIGEAKSARVVGSDASLPLRTTGGAAWDGIPGTIWIDVPDEVQDEIATVIAVEFADPFEVYRGTGRAA